MEEEEQDPIITEWEDLPQEVKAIFNKYDLYDCDDYESLNKLSDELLNVGWFMDYYLNAEITELRQATQDEINAFINNI